METEKEVIDDIERLVRELNRSLSKAVTMGLSVEMEARKIYYFTNPTPNVQIYYRIMKDLTPVPTVTFSGV